MALQIDGLKQNSQSPILCFFVKLNSVRGNDDDLRGERRQKKLTFKSCGASAAEKVMDECCSFQVADNTVGAATAHGNAVKTINTPQTQLGTISTIPCLDTVNTDASALE